MSEEPITSFRDDYYFLSNFYPSTIRWQGKLWKTVEHAYAAAKTLDEDQRELIRKASTPAMAKKLGRAVTLRENWDEVRLTVMEELLELKFSNPFLKPLLIQTGDRELIEGNNWNDKFWGVFRGEGENNLGRLLMELRQRIRENNDEC